MNPHNQRVLVPHRSARPISRDQVAAHNQQAFISNQLSSSDANYVEQMTVAREQHQGYLSRQEADRPTPSSPEVLASHRGATNLSPLPAQAFLPQEHAHHFASRQAQHRTATQDHPCGPSGGVQVRKVRLPVPINGIRHTNNSLSTPRVSSKQPMLFSSMPGSSRIREFLAVRIKMRMASHNCSTQLVSLTKQALPVLSPPRLRRLLSMSLKQLEHNSLALRILY